MSQQQHANLGFMVGNFQSNTSLDISNFYELAIMTNYVLLKPLEIQISNDNVTFFRYDYLKSNYLYLGDLMANYIKIITDDNFTINYNANLKKKYV